MLWLLLVTATALDCARFLCRELDTDICARMNTRPGSIAFLNQSPCKVGFCSGKNIEAWYLENEERNSTKYTNKLYYCEDIELDDYITDELEVPCPNRSDGKDVLGREWPSNCFNSTDCLMVDGTEGICECGLDGKGYCMPDFSSSLFDSFWNQCSDNGNTVDIKTWIVWNWTVTYYSLIMSSPSCGDDILIELDVEYIIDSIQATATYLAVLATALLCLV